MSPSTFMLKSMSFFTWKNLMTPIMAAMKDSTVMMAPVITGAHRKPPRFSQNSRFNSHLKAEPLVACTVVAVFMRRFLS